MLLTACIAVRSGQYLLHECVASVRAVADEIVFAESVECSPTGRWVDFDDSLNEALSRARGEWILFLEGHERLLTNGPDIRAAIATSGCDAFSLSVRRMWNRLVPTLRSLPPDHPQSHGFLPSIARPRVRLFRRSSGYCFGGRLESSVEPSMRGYAAALHGTLILVHDSLIPDTPYRVEAQLEKARKLVQRRPEDPYVWMDLARCQVQFTYKALAIESFLGAWKLAPETSICLEAASAFMVQRRLEDALAFLERAADAQVTDRDEAGEADVWELRGEILRLLDRNQDAATAYAHVLATDGDRPLARIGLVEVLSAHGRIDEARLHVEWLRQHYPGASQVWMAAAIIHLEDGQLLSAIEMLKVALDIEPTSAMARYNLGIAYARLGALSSARDAFWYASTVRGGIMLAQDVKIERPNPPPNPDLQPLGRNGIVSFIPYVAGGAGRVAVDIIRCLTPPYRHVLITYDRGDFVGMGLLQELKDLKVPVFVIGSGDQLAPLLRLLEPEIILNHSGPPQETIHWTRDTAFLVSMSHGGGSFGYTHHNRYVCLTPSQRRIHAYVPEDRVRIIPNGVDLTVFENVTPDMRIWGEPDAGTVKIAMLTRLDPEKCTRRLLHCLEPLSDLNVKVVVAGQGARRWEIQGDLAKFRIGAKVHFAGSIPSHAVPSFLAAADIGLHLTETSHEALSISILEMLAAGLPVVSQPRGCLPELVIHETNGFLFEDELEIATALRRLVLSTELRAMMGAASRKRAESYGMPLFQENWRTFIAECVAGHRSRPMAEPYRIRDSVVPRNAGALIERLTSVGASRHSYFIASSRRSGGTWLCSALQSTGVAGWPREDLALWIFKLRGRSWRYRHLDDYLKAQWQLGASVRGVYGSLLMFSHLETLCESYGTPDWPSDWLEKIGAPRWIFLRRRDHTAQAISLYKAETTGLWRDVGEARMGVMEVRYDRAAIENCRQRIERDDRAWQTFFETFALEPIEIFYEDLADDLDRVVRLILGKLEVQLPVPFYCHSPMRRQADEQTRDWIARFARGD